MSTSALYELIEWWAALLFGGGVGTAYLGSQGDPWDAQADMALAGAGCLLVLFGLWLGGGGRAVPESGPSVE